MSPAETALVGASVIMVQGSAIASRVTMGLSANIRPFLAKKLFAA